jgi:nucleolar MIF4G domain-containing protein 1
LFVISVIHCLSLDKTRLNVAKLNKEYEVNEGIGGGFGEFLMDLDDLTSGILGKAKSRKSLYSEKKNSKQQTKRKDEEEEDENEGEEDNEVDEEAVNEEDGDGSEAEEEDENDSVDEKEEAEEAQKDKALTPFTYKPIAGEDIYGRVVDPNSQSSSAPSKYVPPGRRNLQNSSSSSSVVTLGTLSEKDLLLKRKLRGLLNKISEQSKDSILRELKQHYEQSSHNLTNEILLDSMIEMSTTTTASKLVNLIPLYASILSSLYFHVSSDIIYYSIERIFMKILWYCQDFMEKLAGLEEGRGNDQGEEKEEDFTASHHRPVYNLLLFLLYFYNFRVFHHSFIVELMNGILQENDKNPFFTTSDHSRKEINEMKMELLECIIYHASDALRHDDPMVMKQLAQELSQKMKSTLAAKNEREGEGEEESDYSRLQFLYECVHDQMNSGSRSHNNRMKKIKEPIAAFIQEKRKWLGNNKKMLGNKMGDIVVRLTITDLLNVETQGRWWKTGASWIGRQQQQLQDSEQQQKQKQGTTGNRQSEESSSSSSASLLIKKAAKENHMNTPIRQSIFEQIMLSRDILDAYERIMKLSITGKNDREIIRVLIECCLIEKTYNSFYKELMKLFSEYNRQYKMTIQYLLWDVIKRLLDEDNDNSDDEDDEEQKKGGKLSQRQILNLGRLSSDLIESFVIPLSAIFKILDISAITENTSVQLYLMTFFVQLFSTKTLDVNTLQTICDRIATTPDYRQVCDHLLCFLEVSELNSCFFLILILLLILNYFFIDAIGSERDETEVFQRNLRANERKEETHDRSNQRDQFVGSTLSSPRSR